MRKRMANIVAILAVSFGAIISKAASESNGIQTVQYAKCPKGFESEHSGQSAPGRSPLDCIQRCSQMTGCSGVNICPTGLHRKVSCWLAEAVQPGRCVGLTATSSPSCYYAQKLDRFAEVTTEAEETTTTQEPTTTQLECLNGGTPAPNGQNCQCPVKYSGTTCQRLIRDCTEGYENGYQSTTYNGPYYIQPATSPSHFLVSCDFQWGGVTYPFRRSASSDFNQNWTTCKAGFGDDLLLNPDPENFFIGLENLHHLLNQAEFDLHIYMYKFGSAYYDNFAVGNESTSYAVTFDQFYSDSDDIGNGFSASLPVKFSAQGHDFNGCYSQNNTAGWYGQDCSGYSIFSASSLHWPKDGVAEEIDDMEFNLLRVSPYYDE